MDFVTSLPKTMKGCNSIWVDVDRLTKPSHFILVKISCPLQKLDELYVENIFSLHGIASSTVSLLRSEIHFNILGEFVEGIGYQVEVDFFLPSADERLNRKDHPIFRGFFERLCARTRRRLG